MQAPDPLLSLQWYRSNFTGAGVTICIIEASALDFRDALLRKNGKTKISQLWYQGLTPLEGERGYASKGVVYDASRINEALQLDDPFSVIRAPATATSHATRVTKVATSVAPDASLVFVCLGDLEDETVARSSALLLALRFITTTVHGPYVINISLGQNLHSHDAWSPGERLIDEHLTTAIGSTIVLYVVPSLFNTLFNMSIL